MRMPVLGAAIGGLALGAFLVAGSRYLNPPATAASPTPSSGSAPLVGTGADLSGNPVLVDCAEGQRAVVKHVAVGAQTVAQVQCVGQPVVSGPFDDASMSFAPTLNGARAYTVSQTRPVSYAEPAPVRTRAVAAPAPVVYRTAAPARTRTWKKSALIIGGSAAGGAGLGAIVGGKGGAAKGAVIGGIAGVVYDVATRNKSLN